MKPVSPSDLNRRITFQIRTRVPDGMGSFTITWTDHATVWARAWTVSSSENLSDGKLEMIRIQKFCIRFRNILRPDWRIKYGDRYFNISAIDPDQTNEWIYITAKEAG